MSASTEVRPPAARAAPRKRLCSRLVRQSAEVERITGVRLVPLEGQKAMRVEYRIKWKDNAPDSWCASAAASHRVAWRAARLWWLPLSPSCCLPPPALRRREPARNLAEDVLREFEGRWWASARRGDVKELTDMLAGGREVLATTVDDNGRACVRRAPHARVADG